MNQEKLTQLSNTLQEMTQAHFVSGVTCMVIQNGEEKYYYETGLRDIDNKQPMTRDTIFRMYSMTKPVTATAAMMLLEEGKIDLLEPVFKYLSGFANQYIITDGKMIPVTRPVLIQDLLNMTSGLVYPGEGNPAEVRTGILLEEVIDKAESDHPLTTLEIMNRLGEFPLAFDPGEKWQYGMSADVLAAVIEAASGMKFSEFLSQRIFEPLGMKDTGFYVPQEKQNRLAKVYEESDAGLKECHFPHLAIQNHMKYAPAYESGGAGLVSTIDDYAAFTQMLLNKGSYQGKTFLSPKTVEFMTSAHLTDSQQRYVNQWENLPGYTYTNLLRILVDPGAAVTLGSKGEYGWDGWLGTYMTNDPAHQMTLLIMQQKTNSGTTLYTRKIRNILFSALD